MKTLCTLLCSGFILFGFAASAAHAQNHVLSLDGDGDYVEITKNDGLNALASQVTMEAWIKPTAFTNKWMLFIYKGDKRTSDACENRSYVLSLNRSGLFHLASAPSGQGQVYLNSPSGLITLNKWYHVAGIIDAKSGVMSILINGVEVARRDFGKDIHLSSLPLRIGGSHEAEIPEHSPFAGQIDEVRIWNIARTAAEIVATMHTTLTGREPGLVGYWDFEEGDVQALDVTGNGHDGKFVGDARRVLSELPTSVPKIDLSLPPSNSVNGEYIKGWLVLGPFFPDDLGKDFLADVGGEANINPKAGDTVMTADGKTLTWKRYQSNVDIINLLDAVGNHEHATAYAFCVLQSETAGNAEISLGSDDGVVVWMDGKRVHHNPVNRPVTLDQDTFEVGLKAGANRCLVKVSNGVDGWGFAMRALPPNRAVLSGIVANERGNPIPNASVRLEQTLPSPLMGEGPGVRVQTQTDEKGSYRISVYPVRGRYDLYATHGQLGAWEPVQLREGERRTLNLTLKPAVRVSGNITATTGHIPLANLTVQALRNGEVIYETKSDDQGAYQLVNLPVGDYHILCKFVSAFTYYPNAMAPENAKTVRVTHESLTQGVDILVSPSNAEGRYELARLLARAGQYQLALEQCQLVLAEAPTHLEPAKEQALHLTAQLMAELDSKRLISQLEKVGRTGGDEAAPARDGLKYDYLVRLSQSLLTAPCGLEQPLG